MLHLTRCTKIDNIIHSCTDALKSNIMISIDYRLHLFATPHQIYIGTALEYPTEGVSWSNTAKINLIYTSIFGHSYRAFSWYFYCRRCDDKTVG